MHIELEPRVGIRVSRTTGGFLGFFTARELIGAITFGMRREEVERILGKPFDRRISPWPKLIAPILGDIENASYADGALRVGYDVVGHRVTEIAVNRVSGVTTSLSPDVGVDLLRAQIGTVVTRLDGAYASTARRGAQDSSRDYPELELALWQDDSRPNARHFSQILIGAKGYFSRERAFRDAVVGSKPTQVTPTQYDGFESPEWSVSLHEGSDRATFERARDHLVTCSRYRLSLDLARVDESLLELLRGLDGVTNLSILFAETLTERAAELFATLPALEGLSLRSATITPAFAEQLARCTRLKRLFVEQSTLNDETLPHVASLPTLEALHAGRAELRGDSLDALAANSALRELDIGGNPIDDASITKLAASTSLEYLNAYGTNVTDVGLLTLSNIRTLRRVQTRADFAVTLAGVNALRAARPDVIVG